MFTPERISKLEPNQIFVFGSNLHGQHAGGAARVAFDKFGAIWGQGVGMQGQCYAIPTMQGGVETIKPYVDEFIEFAKAHTEYTFLVTRIGCGIAGFKDSEIAPLFDEALGCENITLPKEFVEVLTRKSANPSDTLLGWVAEVFLSGKTGGMDYRTINRKVMTDTKDKYESLPELQEAVLFSIKHQYMVAQEERIELPSVEVSSTKYITSGKRTFEAAKGYVGKKVAVLNFANNHSVGGAPFAAGAQEESLCRCSTLYPCLQAMYTPFYKRHQIEYEKHLINAMGNDDIIYTPDVVVFKTDERTDPIYPKMMRQSEWYKVDVITCAAPELMKMKHTPKNYEEVICSRVKKILDVAAKENVEVLILGAWGCGAFKNDSKVVSKAFFSLLENYNFETVEFALASNGDVSGSLFCKENSHLR